MVGPCPDIRLFVFSLINRAYPNAQPIFSTKVFHPIEYLALCVFVSSALRPVIFGGGTCRIPYKIIPARSSTRSIRRTPSGIHSRQDPVAHRYPVLALDGNFVGLGSNSDDAAIFVCIDLAE